MSDKTLNAEDLYRISAVGDPQVSPSGEAVAYVRQEFDRDKNKTTARIWTAGLRGGPNNKQLTRGDDDRYPRWAPDGRRLAFVSTRGGKKDVYILDTAGGEAWPLGVDVSPETAPVWSPDGTRVAFVARGLVREAGWRPYPGCPDYDADRARRAAREELKPREEREDDPILNIKVITETRYRFDGMGFFGDLRRQVFVADVPACPHQEAVVRRVSSLQADHAHVCWSPDGRFLAFSAFRPDASADQLAIMDIWRVDVGCGEAEQVVRAQGPVSGLSWSPDGQYLASVGHHSERGLSTSTGIYLIPLARRDAFPLGPEDLQCLTGELDRPVGAAISSDVRHAGDPCHTAWSGDSGSLYFLVGDRGTCGIYRADREKGWSSPTAVVKDRERSIASFSVTSGEALVFQACTADSPDEIHALLPEGEEIQLTRENEFLEGATVSPRRITWEGPGGLEIEGWLYLPQGAEEPRPTVLMIHGGPHGVYGSSFNFLTQYLVSRGHAVLMPNPRGSQTYGQEFALQVVGNWGRDDFEDLMAGVDTVVEMGAADPDRLGVTGWSYGGFMTNWVAGRTRRFKAAVSGACVFNNLDFYGTSDIGLFFGEFQWQGNPWDSPDVLLDLSPLKHTGQVETPVLLLHGEADLRCPLSQSEQMYAALKRRGREAVLVTYPGEYHSLSQPVHRVDRCQRTADWFHHYLLS